VNKTINSLFQEKELPYQLEAQQHMKLYIDPVFSRNIHGFILVPQVIFITANMRRCFAARVNQDLDRPNPRR